MLPNLISSPVLGKKHRTAAKAMNNSELYEFVAHMTEDQRSLAMTMPFTERLIFVVPLILSVVWGTLMKLFIYYSLWQENLSKRPINILILMDQVIDHITKTFIVGNAIVMVRNFCVQ